MMESSPGIYENPSNLQITIDESAWNQGQSPRAIWVNDHLLIRSGRTFGPFLRPEIVDWLRDNMNEQPYQENGLKVGYCVHIWFRSERDYALFKLFWLGDVG